VASTFALRIRLTFVESNMVALSARQAVAELPVLSSSTPELSTTSARQLQGASRNPKASQSVTRNAPLIRRRSMSPRNSP
jgi:hypothetical protein